MKQEKRLELRALKTIAKGIRSIAETSVDSQCCWYTYEPKIPHALKKQVSK